MSFWGGTHGIMLWVYPMMDDPPEVIGLICEETSLFGKPIGIVTTCHINSSILRGFWLMFASCVLKWCSDKVELSYPIVAIQWTYLYPKPLTWLFRCITILEYIDHRLFSIFQVSDVYVIFLVWSLDIRVYVHIIWILKVFPVWDFVQMILLHRWIICCISMI